MRIYKPDGWVCLKITNNTHSPIYRIFGSWGGGFTSSDSWRLSSGFSGKEPIDIEGGFLTIPQMSGSIYRVNIAMQNVLTCYNRTALEELIRRAEEEKDSLQIMEIDLIELECQTLSALKEQLKE
ncbi:hypothetical protein LC147_22810 [Vibrio harveyi]|uniref:hypothetical protein n=1 Tax=Vibrio harveyi TaxID=669 RepID=UPI003BB6477C